MKKFNSQIIKINSDKKIVAFFFEVDTFYIAKVSTKRRIEGGLEMKISFLNSNSNLVEGYSFPKIPNKKELKGIVHSVFKQIEQALFNE